MEFFSSLEGRRVWLSSNRVRLESSAEESGEIGRLVNGKMKVRFQEDLVLFKLNH